MGLITGSGMPLTAREFAFVQGETMMTIWFAKYGVSMDRIEEGMNLVREQVEGDLAGIGAYDMAPSVLDPIEVGMRYAEDSYKGEICFVVGEARDFGAIVRATVLSVIASAYAARNTSSAEELLKHMTDASRTDKSPQCEG